MTEEVGTDPPSRPGGLVKKAMYLRANKRGVQDVPRRKGCGAGEWDARVAAAAQVGGDDALQGEEAEPGARGCGRLV